MRALRRNRFLSKCKFGHASDDANGWMREKMVGHADTRKGVGGKRRATVSGVASSR